MFLVQHFGLFGSNQYGCDNKNICHRKIYHAGLTSAPSTPSPPPASPSYCRAWWCWVSTSSSGPLAESMWRISRYVYCCVVWREWLTPELKHQIGGGIWAKFDNGWSGSGGYIVKTRWKKPYMEVDLWWKTTFDWIQPWMTITLDGRQPLRG